MQKLKTTANLAGIVAVIIAVLQWIVAMAQPITDLLLALGVSLEVIETVKTIIILILTLLGALAAYQVKARRVWAG